MFDIDIKTKTRGELIKAYKRILHMIKDNEYGLNNLSSKELKEINIIKKQIRDEIAIKDYMKKGACKDAIYNT